jgi:uncharacterized protein YndB with AHSA1/START domain
MVPPWAAWPVATSAAAGEGDFLVSSLELVIHRLVNAPRERVWRAWTDPAELKEWWSPVLDADVRANGAWKAEVVSPDGSKAWSHGTYVTVDAPKQVVYTFEWDATDLAPTTVDITLADNGASCEMTVRQSGFTTEADRDGHIPGWNTAFDELEAFLARQ